MSDMQIHTFYRLSADDINYIKQKYNIVDKTDELEKNVGQLKEQIQAMQKMMEQQQAMLNQLIQLQMSGAKAVSAPIQDTQPSVPIQDIQPSAPIQDTQLSAPQFNQNDTGCFEIDEQDSHIIIKKYIGNDTKVFIPKSINGKPVTVIDKCTFWKCTTLEEIIIPDSITSIDNGTFYRCSNLKSIIFPNSVTFIGHWIFEGCTSLKSVTLSDSITSIKSDTFRGCTSLESITIPNSVKEIGEDTFKNCPNLTIYGKMFSYAIKYAKENNIKFKYI